MKIAFPTVDDKGLDSTLGDHFGRSPVFTIIDIESNEIKAISNASDHFGGAKSPPEFLRENGVDTLICKGLGRKAIALFNQLGIAVYVCSDYTVKEALDSFNGGNLTLASQDDGCPGRHH